MDNQFVFEAIKALRPGAEFSIWTGDISTLQWILPANDFVAPTETEILDKVQQLKTQHLAFMQENENAKTSAKTKLAALGLTEDEVNAIIRGI